MATHFWNFEDENLKSQAGAVGQKDSTGLDVDQEAVFNAQLASSSVLYYEQRVKGQMMPRTIMTDFRDNFGNFSACFAVESQTHLDKNTGDGDSSMWEGAVQVTEEA